MRMAAFAYSAINALGAESAGEITAPDASAARELLRQKGLRPVSLSEVGAQGAGGRRRTKVKPRSLQVFSRQFATMIDAGLSVVDIIKGLEIAGQTSGNWVVESALADVRAKVHEGVPIAQPLVESPVFPPLVSQMVKVGEETGELERMLDKIADFYEDEVDTSIASLTSIVEPIMMVGVGAIIGVIVIAMYLPMFKLLELVQ